MSNIESELAYVFGTKSRLGIIDELARNGSQKQVELAVTLGVTQATISREKQVLSKAGVITEQQSNGSTKLKLRDDYKKPFLDILRSLRMSDTAEVVTNVNASG